MLYTLRVRRYQTVPSLRGPRQSHEPPRMPLRWIVILAVAVEAGLVVGYISALVPGVVVGVALAGLLHQVID